MVRILYRWHVEPANQRRFSAAWKQATTHIRETTQGARGSVLLHNQDDPNLFITLARWDKLSDWQAFWEKGSHTNMDTMHALGTRLSVEVWNEVDDETI